MIANELIKNIESGGLDEAMLKLYGASALECQRARYAGAVGQFRDMYGGDREISLFSVPGRSEISGNHTDHNHGRVLAAAVSLDIIAVASVAAGSVVRVKSFGFDEDVVDIDKYIRPQPEYFGKSSSILAGVADGFRNNRYAVGGFDAYTTSDVLGGSGLSSSAAFENMIGTIFNNFYNDGRIGAVEIAKISQHAENAFFGKPCGLMDQLASAVGGFVAIDFADPTEPVIKEVDFDLAGAGYSLCIVNTGSSHADLGDEYAAVPAEMKSAARFLGQDVLRGITVEKILAYVPALRESLKGSGDNSNGCGDRAILRALHFINENDRVAEQTAALENDKIDRFLELVTASGRSSFCYLQNIYTPKDPADQSISLALCLAETVLANRGGAWRVHGGGFAGTIQAFVPVNAAAEFRNIMESTFGSGAVTELSVRGAGAVKVF